MYRFHFTKITLVGLKSNGNMFEVVWGGPLLLIEVLVCSLVSEEVTGAAAWSLPRWPWLSRLSTRSSVLWVTWWRTSARRTARTTWWPEIRMAWGRASVVGMAGRWTLAHRCSSWVVWRWSALGLHSLQVIKVGGLSTSVGAGSSRTSRATSHALGALSHCFLS